MQIICVQNFCVEKCHSYEGTLNVIVRNIRIKMTITVTKSSSRYFYFIKLKKNSTDPCYGILEAFEESAKKRWNFKPLSLQAIFVLVNVTRSSIEVDFNLRIQLFGRWQNYFFSATSWISLNRVSISWTIRYMKEYS